MSRPSLTLVATPPYYCMPWHACRDGETDGRVCCFCARAIGAPSDIRNRPVACIYCGFANGDVPLEEVPPDGS